MIDAFADEEISIGDYILTGGELASLVVADSVLRLKPGVLAEQKGYEEESYWDGLLEYPQYTRPEVWEGRAAVCRLSCWRATTRRSMPGGGSRAGSAPVCAARSSTSSGVRPIPPDRDPQVEAGRECPAGQDHRADGGCRKAVCGGPPEHLCRGLGAGSAGCPDPGDVPAAAAAGKSRKAGSATSTIPRMCRMPRSAYTTRPGRWSTFL